MDYGNDIHVFYQRVRIRMMVDELVLNSVGPEHNVNGMEQGMESAAFE